MKRGPRREAHVSMEPGLFGFGLHTSCGPCLDRSLEQIPEQLVLIDISDFEVNDDHYRR